MAYEFVPDDCSALVIQGCITAKKCFIEKAKKKMGGLNKRASVGTGNTAAASLQMSEDAQCMLDGFIEAFAAAGLEMPAVPEPPEPPDTSSITEGMGQVSASITANASDPLGFLSGIIEMELDDNDRPTLIRVL